ncbi:MAG TPA: helix-turn-helix transcriptional regulator, partial [Pilimelia sp.]|nr:helix-turn-helix transcriptional regulator [Pilimelia sp.]
MLEKVAPDKSTFTPVEDPILTAKINVPGLPAWLVDRPRLTGRLTRGVDGPLTVLTAPAGSGKTFLASAWAARTSTAGGVAWLSLDDHDNSPGVFWSYLLASLARGGVHIAAAGRPAPDESIDRSFLIRLVVALSERREPVVLLLDNAHVLTGPAVAGLDFLLRHAGPHLRTVLLSRGRTSLPLHRYRLAGLLTEVGFDELAFTEAEARALAATHHVRLPDAAVAALTEHTQGWAAGLRMTVRAMRHRQRSDARGGPDGHGDLAEYFRAEVLDKQPPDVREFLLCTSVVKRLRPALAAELSGRPDAARILATLARDNTFVAPVPGDRTGYEYVPVIRQLLRTELDRERPARLPALNRTAAVWFSAAGQPTDAVLHAAESGDWEYATVEVVRGLSVGQFLVGPRAARLATSFAAMPADLDTAAAAAVRAA